MESTTMTTFGRIRLFFVSAALIFSLIFAYVCASTESEESFKTNLALYSLIGALLVGSLFLIERQLKKADLRKLGLTLLALPLGVFLGACFSNFFDACIGWIYQENLSLIRIYVQCASILVGCFVTTILAARIASELSTKKQSVSSQEQPNKKTRRHLIDRTALFDPRLLELARTGLLDQQLLVLNSLRQEPKALEIIVRLTEELPSLELAYTDSEESAPPLNINTLASALKPVLPAGESLKIKIQRQGKEPQQGVGYLEDGTMVVVNGGGRFLGEEIEVSILSVKQTSAGRLIFCNTAEGVFRDMEECSVREQGPVTGRTTSYAAPLRK